MENVSLCFGLTPYHKVMKMLRFVYPICGSFLRMGFLSAVLDH